MLSKEKFREGNVVICVAPDDRINVGEVFEIKFVRKYSLIIFNHKRGNRAWGVNIDNFEPFTVKRMDKYAGK